MIFFPRETWSDKQSSRHLKKNQQFEDFNINHFWWNTLWKHGSITARPFLSPCLSLMPRPQYAGEIWRRNNHRSFWICVWGNLGQRNHLIILLSSFSKSAVSQTFSVHTKSQNRRFQILPVRRLKSVFAELRFGIRISVDGRSEPRRKKAAFSNLSGVLWAGPQYTQNKF